MTGAGELRHRVGFFQRAVISDGYGNNEDGYPADPVFQCAADVAVKFGGEAVLADRLRGEKTATITVRRSTATLAVSEAWRIKDMRDGTVWNIRSGPVDPDDGRMWLEFLCQSGSGVGS